MWTLPLSARPCLHTAPVLETLTQAGLLDQVTPEQLFVSVQDAAAHVLSRPVRRQGGGTGVQWAVRPWPEQGVGREQKRKQMRGVTSSVPHVSLPSLLQELTDPKTCTVWV